MEHSGWADERFGAVAEAFSRNFDEYGELGAAVTLFVDGRKVVDLWGGVADKRSGRPWEEDTVIPVFSCAKGIVSICAHVLAQEGRLDLDAPVGRYWPEFAQGGKEAITSRMPRTGCGRPRGSPFAGASAAAKSETGLEFGAAPGNRRRRVAGQCCIQQPSRVDSVLACRRPACTASGTRLVSIRRLP